MTLRSPDAKALEAFITVGRPRSALLMPSGIMNTRIQIYPKSIEKMALPMVMLVPTIPPTINAGTQIRMPDQMNPIDSQLFLSDKSILPNATFSVLDLLLLLVIFLPSFLTATDYLSFLFIQRINTSIYFSRSSTNAGVCCIGIVPTLRQAGGRT